MKKSDYNLIKNCFKLVVAIGFTGQSLLAQDLKWAKGFGGNNHVIGYFIDVDPSGNVLTTGSFMDTADLNPGSGVYQAISKGKEDIYVQKLDANGNFLWAKYFGGTEIDQPSGLFTDKSGNVITVGLLRERTDMDPGPGVFNLTGTRIGPNIFVQKLDANGNFMWAKQVGTTGSHSVYSVVQDAKGNILIAGQFLGTSTDFDPGVGTAIKSSAGNSDWFLVKLDANGNFIWVKTFGGTLFDFGQAVDVNSKGEIALAGIFYDSVDFDPGAGVYKLGSQGVYDAAVVKLDSGGNFKWVKQFGSSRNEGIHDIQISEDGDVIVAGKFRGTVDFNPGAGVYNLVAPTNDDHNFVVKLDSSGDFKWAGNFSATTSSGIKAIELDDEENVYMTGNYAYAGVDFDPGTSKAILPPGGGYDYFLLKWNQAGKFVWVHGFSGVNTDQGGDIVIRDNKTIYTTGSFSDTIDFDPGTGVTNLIPTPVPFQSKQNAFVHKLEIDNCSNLRRIALDPGTYKSTFSKTEGGWTHYCSASEDLLLSINTTGSGAVIPIDGVELKIEPSKTSSWTNSGGMVKNIYGGAVINRRWLVNPSTQASTGPVKVRYYFSNEEYLALKDTLANHNGGITPYPTSITSEKDLEIHQYNISANFNSLHDNGTLGTFLKNGNTANTTSWVHTKHQTNDHMAEFAVNTLMGGGIGFGGDNESLGKDNRCTQFSTSVAYVNHSATGINNGTSWENAYTNLQDALDLRMQCNKIDTIKIAEGIYYPEKFALDGLINLRDRSFFLADSNVIILGGYNAKAGTQSGGKTYLDGDLSQAKVPSGVAYHVFITADLNSSTQIKNLTIRNGNANGGTGSIAFGSNSFTRNFGGGMYNNGSSPTIENVTFTENKASTSGGGMCNATYSSPKITNVVFENNHATSSFSSGGAIYNFRSSPDISNVVFDTNTAVNEGGAVSNVVSSMPDFTNVVFNNNYCKNEGGGLHNKSSDVSLINVSFINNSTQNGQGGGIRNESSSILKLKNVLFYGNKSNGLGNDIHSFKGIIAENIHSASDIATGVLNTGSGFVDLSSSYFADLFADSNKPAGNDGVWMTADDGLNLIPKSKIHKKGDMTGSSIDILGVKRPYRPSIGAYDYSSCNKINANTVYVDINAKGLNNGSSWINAFTDLQDALDVRMGCANMDSILIAEGTYYPTISPFGVNEDRYKSFHLRDSNTIVIGGYNAAKGTADGDTTILSGNIGNVNDLVDNTFHVLILSDLDTNSQWFNLSIRRAYAGGVTVGGHSELFDNKNFNYKEGAGMYMQDASPIFTNVQITDNLAESRGGGLLCFNSNPTFKQFSVSRNVAQNHSGGGVYCQHSNIALENATISFNRNSSLGGGGIYLDSSSVLSINKAQLLHNTGSVGGAIQIGDKCVAHLNNVVLHKNTGSYGGGIYTTASSSLFMNNAVLSKNTAKQGAGIFNQGDMVLNNGTFFANEVKKSSTLLGPAIYTSGNKTEVNNSLFMNNFGGPEIWATGTSSITGTNNASDSGTSSLSNTGLGFVDLTNVDSSQIFKNPKSLAGFDNTWFTEDDGTGLKFNSVLSQAGNNTKAPSADILGVTRPSQPSIGAYEHCFATEFITSLLCEPYVSPSKKYTWVNTGIYTDSFESIYGCDTLFTIELTPFEVTAVGNLDTITSEYTGTSYQWVDCDNNYAPISGATEKQYIATKNGNYAAIVKDGNCIDTTNCINVNTLSKGVLITTTGSKVYPNPATQQLYVALPNGVGQGKCHLVDLNGRLILSKKLTGNATIDIGQVSNGVYILLVDTSGIHESFKINIEN